MLTDNMLRLRMLGLLMLMFSLCDADECFDALITSVILDPPEVLEKYNESATVTVNCTILDDLHSGMYWHVGNTDLPEETENNYIISSVKLSDWDATAECRIKMNDTHECSKELNITIYQNPVMVNVFPIKHGAALEGTPFELQCDVNEVAPVQNLKVRWYKDNGFIREDTFANTTKRPVSESSVLEVNISRGENEVQFRCEAQLDFGPNGPQLPVVSDTRNVSVHYAPELMNKTEDVYVSEGDSVTLNCEAEARPPPKIQWIDPHNKTNVINTVNLNIARVVTNATYECSAINYLGNLTKQIHVHVKKLITPAAAPADITTPEPSPQRDCPIVLTPPEVVVKFGDRVSVNCSTSAPDVSKMGWEAKVGGSTTEDSSVVTWMVENVEDWAIKPLCYINLKDHQCFEMLNITLYKTPDNVSVSELDQGPMVEGIAHQLLCNATKVTPVQNLRLTWYRGDETIDTTVFNGTSNSPEDVTHVLRVIPERDDNKALFRCEAELLLGPNGPELIPSVISSPYMAVVHYEPLIKDCPEHHAGVEHYFSMGMLPCEVDGNPRPSVQWYYEEKPISASEPLNRTQSGEYTAEIKNSLGSISTTVFITVEYEPSFACDDHFEVVEGGALQCEAYGIPTPVITYFKDGKEMASPPRWTKHDSGNYSLNATNTRGFTIHNLYVDVLYAPVLTQGSSTWEVSPGDNLTFDCSAVGNPAPDIHWDYTTAVNVRTSVTTGGSQKNISITGATSTNAGVYSCNATNKVGSKTRTVTLIMKDGNKSNPMPVLWWVILFLVILLLIVIIVIAYRWKKHGRYNFVPDRANDSDIPMSAQSNGVQPSAE